MKRIILTVVAGLALSLGGKAQALTTPGNGLQAFAVAVATPGATPVLLSVGRGSLDSLNLSSANAAGDFCQFYDVATVSLNFISIDTNSVNAPMILNWQAAATNTNYVYGGGTPSAPKVPFTSGLAVICNTRVRLTGGISQ